jgi:hypothetical protein
VEAVAEGVDALFGAGFLFVATRAAERGVKAVFVQRLLQPSVFMISVCWRCRGQTG